MEKSLTILMTGSMIFLGGCAQMQKTGGETMNRAVASSSNFRNCEEQTTGKDVSGNTVQICQKLFPTRPYLRLPAPTLSDPQEARITGILESFEIPNDDEREIRGYRSFRLIARYGRFDLVDSEGQPLRFSPETFPDPWLNVQNTVYEVVGDVRPGTKDQVIPRQINPFLIIPGCAFDGLFAGVWTAKVSKRNAGRADFNPKALVPLRITISQMTPFREFEDIANYDPVNDDNAKALPGSMTYSLVGTIDNLFEDVKGPTGTFPSLQALGAENPFLGATSNEISLQRYPSMHAMNGGIHLTMNWPPESEGLGSNGMNKSASTVIDLMNLVRGDIDSSLTETDMFPHGVSPGFRMIHLRPVLYGTGEVSCPMAARE